MKRITFVLSPILTMIVIWYLLYFIINEPLLVPSLTDVLSSAGQILISTDIFNILSTVYRLFISFMLSAILGITLGFLSAKNGYFEHIQRPYVTILRTIPVLSVIVILFIIFGSHISPYIITFLMIFPLFYQATLEGTKAIDPALIDVLKLNEVHFKESLRYVYIPCLSENLFVTLFQSLGLGIKVLIMSEYLMQVNHSIGYAIFMARVNLNYSDVYAWTLILILIALSFEGLAYVFRKRVNA